MTRRAGAAHSASADHSMTAAELDDECPSVSLDSSCDSSSFDGDDCATTAQKVTTGSLGIYIIMVRTGRL